MSIVFFKSEVIMFVRAKRKERDESVSVSRKMQKIDDKNDDFLAVRLGGDESEQIIADVKMSYIDQLPFELINEVGLFCSGKDVIASACVSKQWNQFFTANNLWAKKLESTFNIPMGKFQRFFNYVDKKFPRRTTSEALAKGIFRNLEKLYLNYNLLPTSTKYIYDDPFYIPLLLACMSNVAEYANDIISNDYLSHYFEMALAANCKEVALELQKNSRAMPKDNHYLCQIALRVGNIALAREIGAQPLDGMLHLAIQQNQKDVIEFLLEMSVDGVKIFSLDEECVRLACENSLPDIFDFFEQKYPNQFDQHAFYCYQMALNGNPWAINYFKRVGCNHEFPIIDTLEHCISHQKDTFLEEDKLNRLTTSDLFNLLKHAASCGNKPALEKILHSCMFKTNKPALYFLGIESLNLAAASNNLDVFTFLLLQGVKPDMSTLRCAASKGARDVMTFLLDEKNKFGLLVDSSVFNCLVLSNDYDLLFEYYDKYVSVDFDDNVDHFVVQSNHPRIVDFVFQRRSLCLDAIDIPLYSTRDQEAAYAVIIAENLLRSAISSLRDGVVEDFVVQVTAATWNSAWHVYNILECILLNPSKYVDDEALKKMLKLPLVRKTNYIVSVLKLMEYADQGLMELSDEERQSMFKLADMELYVECDDLRNELIVEKGRVANKMVICSDNQVTQLKM